MDTVFEMEIEVDKLFEKFRLELDAKCEQLKERLKRVISKDEKIVLKQYIASQKETNKLQKEPSQKKTRSVPFNEGRKMGQKMHVEGVGAFRGRSSSHRGQTYPDDSSSDSD